MRLLIFALTLALAGCGLFRPMGSCEMPRLRTRCAAQAMDGRFELYKTTAKHEADVGRKQRGFPLQAELGG